MIRKGWLLGRSSGRCSGLYLMLILAVPAALAQQSGTKQPGVGYNAGDRAPELTLKDQNDRTVSLSDYPGKNLLLTFSAAWCGPCMDVASFVEGFVKKLNDKGEPTALVEVLVQNEFGGPSETIDAQDWADEFELTSPVLSCDGYRNSPALSQFIEYSRRYGGPAFPTAVLLTPHGRIISVYVGFSQSKISSDFLQQRSYDERTMVDRLLTVVERMKLGDDLTALLSGPLQDALKQMDNRKWNPACDQLDGFINQTQALAGQGLTGDQAAALSDGAKKIQDELGCAE
jgi:peroxiredoxin